MINKTLIAYSGNSDLESGLYTCSGDIVTTNNMQDAMSLLHRENFSEVVIFLGLRGGDKKPEISPEMARRFGIYAREMTLAERANSFECVKKVSVVADEDTHLDHLRLSCEKLGINYKLIVSEGP